MDSNVVEVKVVEEEVPEVVEEGGGEYENYVYPTFKADWEAINKRLETCKAVEIQLLPKTAIIQALASLADALDEVAADSGTFIGTMEMPVGFVLWDVMEYLGINDDEKEAVLGDKLFAYLVQALNSDAADYP